MSDIVTPKELKEVLKEEHKDHEDNTTKPEDDLEKKGGDGSGFTFDPTCNAIGGICGPTPVPPAGACTAAVFTPVVMKDAVLRNPDCDSHASLILVIALKFTPQLLNYSFHSIDWLKGEFLPNHAISSGTVLSHIES